MTKVEREVVFNSENGQKEMTGVRHSEDNVKKKVCLLYTSGRNHFVSGIGWRPYVGRYV